MKQKVKDQILWYLSVRNTFCFDGKQEEQIRYSKNGIDGLKAFYVYDSTGVKKETKHPELFKRLVKTKGSVNLHIKMYAEDRAKGYLPRMEFDKIIDEIKLPDWFVNAVENQKGKVL